MPSFPPTPVFVLSMHAGYACGRSGACCAAGWDIPIDAAGRDAIAGAIERGEIGLSQPADEPLARGLSDRAATWCHEAPGLPPPDVAVLARRPSGDCIFLLRSAQTSCRLQTACGHEALPLSCRQFPRVALADDRGMHVTLSHFCPTAADLLWQDGPPLEVLESPASRQAAALSPGLDARGQWPPVLRRGVLMSLMAWTGWERFCVATWQGRGVSPAGGLAALSAAAETVRSWTPARGPLEEFVPSALARCVEMPLPGPSAFDASEALGDWHAAWAAVPRDRASRPIAPVATDVSQMCSTVEAEGEAVSRYLASKCVASWAAYQGHGLRAFVASVRMALHVALVEAARGAEPDSRRRVREAIRRADLLLMHLADPQRLADAWNRAEA